MSLERREQIRCLYLGGMSPAEIGQSLNLSRGTVAGYLHRLNLRAAPVAMEDRAPSAESRAALADEAFVQCLLEQGGFPRAYAIGGRTFWRGPTGNLWRHREAA